MGKWAGLPTMLEFHPLQERAASTARLLELLQDAKALLQQEGMASMDEYGDMLKWGLPKRDGSCRNIHVFHPDWCTFSDCYKGTIHYHGGAIRGTILLGAMDHFTYEATPDAEGDRFLGDQPYRLKRHERHQQAGTEYALPAMVPHWLKPTELTLTYFEEDDTERMGDLLNPADKGPDNHTWTQEQADALLPVLLERIERQIQDLAAAQTTVAAAT